MKSVVRADTFYCCSNTNKTSPSQLPGEDRAARRLAWRLQEKTQETQRETTGPRGNQPPQDKALPSLRAAYLATAPSRGQALGQGCPNPATGPVSRGVRGWAGAKIPQPPAPGELWEEARGARGSRWWGQGEPRGCGCCSWGLQGDLRAHLLGTPPNLPFSRRINVKAAGFWSPWVRIA